MLCLLDSIRDDDPSLQRLFCATTEAQTLTELLLAAWPLARLLTLHVVEYVLAERALRPTFWPRCPACGAWLASQGFVRRQVTSLFGPLRWRRRVGRCPQGCAIGPVAPFDEEIGSQPHQRTSGERQWLGCALAVFVPFATAARLLGWYSGQAVSARSVWCWVQAAGRRAMDQLQAQLAAVATGDLPSEEPLKAELAALPLLMGADGVMVPFRPRGGQPEGKTRWHEGKVGVVVRLGHHLTRTGKVVTRLHHRRLVAVLGDIEALKPRLWCEAVHQGILSAPRVVWLRDGARGVWRLFDERFRAHATGILDLYHAVQHLWKRATAWLDGRTTHARRWFGWARHRLRHGNPDGVLADLAEALELEGVPDTARETLMMVYAYLARHRDHIDYAAYKELGLPLGSGMVESACT
jgi:hypothetical protein